MRTTILSRGMLAAALVLSIRPAAAQGGVGRAERPDDRPTRASARLGASGTDARALLGLGISSSATDDDTLGVLIASVTPDGPAERAGIKAGNRLAQINDLSLRLDPADVGQRESADLVLRRVARALQPVRPGDAVALRVYADGSFRTVSIRAGVASTTAPVIGMRGRRLPAERAAPPGSDDDAASATLDGLIGAMRDVQAQVDALSQTAGSAALRDALVRAEQQIAEVLRQLTDARAEQQRPAAEWRRGDARAERGRVASPEESLPGLRVTIVGEELEDYFGQGSEGGLLVVRADSSWAPLRSGDVIVRIDGAPATLQELRDALDTRREPTLELLRKRRTLTVRLGARD